MVNGQLYVAKKHPHLQIMDNEETATLTDPRRIKHTHCLCFYSSRKRTLRGRVAAQLRAALAEAALATQIVPGTARELEAHRWAWFMPTLLLRVPVGAAEADQGKTAAVTQLVRRRWPGEISWD